MIRQEIDTAIESLERRATIAQRLIADLTERLMQKESALALLRCVRDDMDADPEREEAMQCLIDSLKLAGVIH